ncbi:acyl-coenzyme A diphosphatase NUDT19 [Hemicordylus capensis]|uniref:acyl-coenzyme A diphosphatase NUDT19 n=1 Tax=Hemicordylus capensis TaxID=884348 RepID=UPI0023045682|nr:acyl-coenzyme A diphosphatase NUDT19 [Hemicordylus capensis]
MPESPYNQIAGREEGVAVHGRQRGGVGGSGSGPGPKPKRSSSDGRSPGRPLHGEGRRRAASERPKSRVASGRPGQASSNFRTSRGTMRSSRPWREAATVLLAAGGCSPRQPPSSCPPPPGAPFDYELLLLRRSPRSAFLPSAHVFPGGTVDAADFSADWRALLPGGAASSSQGGLSSGRPRAPPLFAADRPELSSSPLPQEVAFRLCAIRETFEEAGVLLLVDAAAEPPPGGAAEPPGPLLPPERLPPASELAEWRRRVQRQPASFLQLCRQLRGVPNIWALHEWSKWLTPVGRAGRGGRRYDTVFYLCCLGQGPPSASHDDREVTECQWSTPPKAVELFKSQDIWIAPPQFYELCRLCNFPSLHELHRFGSERALEGCEHWMSVMLIASDGHMQLLPGDELYPEDPDFTGERKPVLTTEKKIEDLMKGASRLHRIVTQDLNVAVHVNIQPKYKHIRPVMMDSKVRNNKDHNSRL